MRRRRQQADPPHWWEPDEQVEHPSSASLQGSPLTVGQAMAGLTPIERPEHDEREKPCCTDETLPRRVDTETADLDDRLAEAEGLRGRARVGPDAVHRGKRAKD